ncbi:hypothetical protein SALBM217S_10411 [Streptomyces griseoloalbus]
MLGRDQMVPQDCPEVYPGMSTAGIDVQRQLESLIQDFRAGDPPMPVIVLHAEDAADDDRVTELVDELREGQQRHGTRLAVAPTEPPQGGIDPTAQAVRLLRDLGDGRKWGDRSASYRPILPPAGARPRPPGRHRRPGHGRALADRTGRHPGRQRPA